MRLKGVNYDVGVIMSFNWRPDFDMRVVRRELEIIKNDLHCNAVRIAGSDVGRVMTAARAGLEQGLEVWLSPVDWDKSPQETLAYITRSAARAEELWKEWPDKVVLIVGSELTLFMRGIMEGRSLAARVANPNFVPRVKAGEHNKPLNDFLSKANASVREVFHGKVAYASLVWEHVDWSLFDFVGVDHYRVASIEDKYVEMLRPSFSYGKPVVITEFGYATCHEGIGSKGLLSTSGLAPSIIDQKSQFLHYKVPLLGRFVRLHLNGEHVRDEEWQARKIVETLAVLDGAGVEGAFISEFVSQITPYNDDPRFDLDMASSSLVKYYEGRRKGTTYPGMPWEPKESFRAVAEYYANH